MRSWSALLCCDTTNSLISEQSLFPKYIQANSYYNKLLPEQFFLTIILPYYLSSRFHCQNDASHSLCSFRIIPYVRSVLFLSCAINIKTATFSTHAANRRFLATEARFRYQDCLRGIYGYQNEIGTGFILAVRFVSQLHVPSY